MTARSAVLGLATSVAFGLTSAGAVAHAAPDAAQARTAVEQPATSDEQRAIDTLAPEVEKLFTQAMSPNDKGVQVFDYEKASANLGKADADRIQAEIDRLVAVEKQNREAARSGATSPGATQDRASGGYASCVLEKAGYGTLVGLFTGAYKELIEKKLWSEVAKVIVKTVGVSAVKGGVVGLAASLTVAAGWCAIFD